MYIPTCCRNSNLRALLPYNPVMKFKAHSPAAPTSTLLTHNNTESSLASIHLPLTPPQPQLLQTPPATAPRSKRIKKAVVQFTIWSNKKNIRNQEFYIIRMIVGNLQRHKLSRYILCPPEQLDTATPSFEQPSGSHLTLNDIVLKMNEGQYLGPKDFYLDMLRMWKRNQECLEREGEARKAVEELKEYYDGLLRIYHLGEGVREEEVKVKVVLERGKVKKEREERVMKRRKRDTKQREIKRQNENQDNIVEKQDLEDQRSKEIQRNKQELQEKQRSQQQQREEREKKQRQRVEQEQKLKLYFERREAVMKEVEMMLIPLIQYNGHNDPNEKENYIPDLDAKNPHKPLKQHTNSNPNKSPPLTTKAIPLPKAQKRFRHIQEITPVSDDSPARS